VGCGRIYFIIEIDADATKSRKKTRKMRTHGLREAAQKVLESPENLFQKVLRPPEAEKKGPPFWAAPFFPSFAAPV
jgi:hypothetical protein